MKNFLFTLIGLLCYYGTAAQLTVTLPPGRIASEEYVNRQIKEKIDSLAIALSKSPVTYIPPVTKPTSPVPVIPTVPEIRLLNCERGPTITKVSYEQSTGLSVVFDGKNVKGLDYLLLGPVYETVVKGSVNPTSNTIRIGYPNLPDGNYHLTLIANTCTGRDSEDFNIKTK